ncbi:hypothetical protein F5146DRAFT_757342 [Armillaria mellea]|nr:hypothetical protein F5146DRAFT_757342 [Armillaria mellea]
MSISDLFTWRVLGAAVLLTIAYKVFWAESSRSQQYILPVHQPQQHQPVYQPPPPSQSYRPTPYTPLLQPEQHRPVSQPPPPPPAPPSPPGSHRSSPYTPPVHQPEQRRPVCQPPPPSQSYRPPSPHGSPKHEVSQPPPPPPSPWGLSPLGSHRSSPYTPPVHQPEQRQPVCHPPPHRPAPPSQSYGPPSPHGPPTHEDNNQQDQPNEHHLVLRVRANKEGDEMGRCFREGREAYDRGDRAAAKFLSNQGKDHKRKMEQLNKEASNFIYLENNRHREPGEIDLHGLYVKEAVTYTDTAIQEAKLRGASEIRLIVGKGTHSEGGEAILRPKIKALMHKYQLVAEFDRSNSGVLVVELNGCPPTRHGDRRRKRRAGNVEV